MGKRSDVATGRDGILMDALRLSRRAVLATFMLVWTVFAGPGVSYAQQDDGLASPGIGYLTPFPEADTYKLQVYGDDFAEGLLAGLLEALPNERGLAIARKRKPISALIRPEHEEEIKSEELSREVVHIAVVMLGYDDRGSIRIAPNVRPLQITSEQWQAEYGRRVDRLLKMLKKRGAAVYLVGQPIMRNPTVQRDAEIINEVLRERALQNAIRFVDIAEGFADDGGSFSQFGPDTTGARQKLREGDGISFTAAGNRKLAHFVERELRRDLGKARAERAIPLAGGEAEQARINPAKAAAGVPAATTKAATTSGGRGSPARSGTSSSTPANAIDSTGDQKADNSRVTIRTVGQNNREEALTIDIVRPALTAAVLALVTRRDVAERSPVATDGIIDDIGDGLTVMSTISAPADLAAIGQGRRVAPNTVLVRGERLAAKPGRSDDASWPRNDLAPLDLPQPAAGGGAAPRGSAVRPQPRTQGQGSRIP